LFGLILPPAAALLGKAPMGFALYNVGFTAGLVGVLVVARLPSYVLVPVPVFIWTTGHNLQLGSFMGVMVSWLMLKGIAIDSRAPARLKTLLRSSGQAPSDFIDLAGLGATMLNIGLTGSLDMVYILAIGVDIDGPVISSLTLRCRIWNLWQASIQNRAGRGESSDRLSGKTMGNGRSSHPARYTLVHQLGPDPKTLRLALGNPGGLHSLLCKAQCYPCARWTQSPQQWLGFWDRRTGTGTRDQGQH
jgi:hypothetical protein